MALVPSTPVSAQATGAATSVTSPAFTSVAGNLLVANAVNGAGGAISATAVSDLVGGLSNTWAQGVALVTDGTTNGLAQNYAKNLVNVGAGHVVKFTPAATDFCSIAVVQISGADTTAPFDKGASSNNGNAAAANPHLSGTTATTTLGDEICVAGMTHNGVGSETFASNNGYTIQTSQTNTANMPIVLSTKIVSATGAQSESYNLTANDSVTCDGLVGTYKSAGPYRPYVTANTNSGTGSAGAAITPAISGLSLGNWAVLLVAQNSGTVSVPTPAGYTAVPSTANIQNPTGTTDDRAIAAFVKQITSTTETASLTTTGKYAWVMFEVAQSNGPRASSGNTGQVTSAGANPTINSGAGVLTNDLVISYVATMTASSTFTAGTGYAVVPAAAPATTNVSSRAEIEMATGGGATAAPFVNASTTLWSELAFAMAPFVPTPNLPILQAIKRASLF